MENIEKAQYLIASGALLTGLSFLLAVFEIDILPPNIFVIIFILGPIILLCGTFWAAYLHLKGSIIDDERTKKIRYKAYYYTFIVTGVFSTILFSINGVKIIEITIEQMLWVIAFEIAITLSFFSWHLNKKADV